MTSQTSDTRTPDLEADEIQLPAVIERNEETVRAGFWTKVSRVAASIPFAEDLVAAYYCTRDPDTPTRVRAILLAALAYFVLPTDLIPDFLLGMGFTDDATVLTAAVGLIAAHLKPEHRQAARAALEALREGKTPADPGAKAS
ncbi:MAG: YkvA family protein [Hyphomicrobiales bacterium]